MVSKLQQKREEIAALKQELKGIADAVENENREFTDEEMKRSEDGYARLPILEKELKKLELLERAESFKSPSVAVISHPTKVKPTAADRDRAFQAWSFYSDERSQKWITDEMKRSCDRCEFDYRQKEFELRRDQTTDTANEGDDLIDDSLFADFVVARKAYGGLTSVASVVNVSTAATQHYAIMDDTGNAASTAGQATALTNTSLGNIDRVSITPKIYSTAVFPVSLQLIRDAKGNVLQEINNALQRRVVSKVDADLTADVVGDLTSGATGISNLLETDNYYDLYYSVDPVYRANAVWMCNDSTEKNIVESAWSDGLPLLNQLSDAPLGTLLGKRVINNQACDTMVTNTPKRPLLFGDFSSVKIHAVGAPKILRSDERFWEYLSVGFIAVWEVWGAYVDAGTHPIKYLATGTGSEG